MLRSVAAPSKVCRKVAKRARAAGSAALATHPARSERAAKPRDGSQVQPRVQCVGSSSRSYRAAVRCAAPLKSHVPSLETISAQPAGEHKGTLIFMHGLGDQKESFDGLFGPGLSVDLPAGWRIVLPDAGMRHITVNGGMLMRAWYDILDIGSRGDTNGLDMQEDETGIASSAQQIHELLDEEAQRVPPENIVLGGFSQGGAMAVHAGLSYSKPLGGIVSCSGYVLLRHKLASALHKANAKTPLLAYNGTADEMVPSSWAARGFKQLSDLRGETGVDYREEQYLPHSLSTQEMQQVSDWLKQLSKEWS